MRGPATSEGVAWVKGVAAGGGACAVGGGSFEVWLHEWVGSKLVVGNNWGLRTESLQGSGYREELG